MLFYKEEDEVIKKKIVFVFMIMSNYLIIVAIMDNLN